MARNTVAMGMTGLFLFFLAMLIAVPFVKSYLFPQISGFQDMTCEVGLKPCPEGYFCEQRTCVPILPRYSMDQVKGNMDQ
jgi:hypothetical protein